MATNEVINLTNYDVQSQHQLETSSQPTVDKTIETNNIDEIIENDDLLEPIDGLKINKVNDGRTKHKNRRYTKSCEYPEENLDKFSAKLSASLPDHFYLNSSAAKNWSKKFSKNSRRSRRQHSRGLAKKGINYHY